MCSRADRHTDKQTDILFTILRDRQIIRFNSSHCLPSTTVTAESHTHTAELVMRAFKRVNVFTRLH